MLSQARDYLRVARETISPLGVMVVAIGAVAWIAGATLGWRELMVIAATVVLLALIAIGFTVGRLDLTSSITVSPSRVMVGERAAGELRLHNNRTRTVRSLRVEMPVGKVVAAFPLPLLRGGEETDELFVVPTNRRAVIPVGPVSTVQGDPLGMLRRTQLWSDVDEIFVHPKTVSLGTIAAGLIRDMEGQATNRLSPSDVAFHTLRDYVPGDDRRHIHWKSSAKLNKLQVRQYVDTRRSHVAVLLSIDLDEYTDEDEFELSVSCAASVAVQALREDQTLSMFAGTKQLMTLNARALLDQFSVIEGTSGRGGMDDCLRAMRTLAADASVAVVCIGANPSIPELHRSATRVPSEASTVVFRSALESDPGLQHVGSNTFVNVPNLPALGRGLAAVAT